MSSDVLLLEPVTRGMCKALLAKWEEGMHPPIRVTHTLRTWDEQMHLYAQGRLLKGKEWVVVDPKKVVTKALPGKSAHNYGAAFDVCFVGSDPYLHKYQVQHGAPDPLWKLLGGMGTGLGLNWGGPLGEGDKFSWDSPHFERADWRTLRVN